MESLLAAYIILGPVDVLSAAAEVYTITNPSLVVVVSNPGVIVVKEVTVVVPIHVPPPPPPGVGVGVGVL